MKDHMEQRTYGTIVKVLNAGAPTERQLLLFFWPS